MSGAGKRALVWVRRDLRVADNHALYHASRWADDGVVAVFVVSPEEWSDHDDAGIKIDFWLRNLREMRTGLAKLNIPLVFVTAKKRTQIVTSLLNVAKEAKAGALFFNNEYEVNEARRDETVQRHFEKHAIEVRRFDDHVLITPGEVRTGQGGFFTVFTPFKKALYKILQERPVEVLGMPKKQPDIGVKSGEVPDHVPGFEPHVGHAAELWPAGEKWAHRRLEAFIEKRIGKYKDDRDTPSLDGTSMLSPHLAAGVVSPRQCVAAALEWNKGKLDAGSAGAMQWISEVVWREFYQHIIVGFPRVVMGRAFKPATDKLAWSYDERHFERWKTGKTGVSIVDAAMRQLLEVGWMHNRLRMVTAMYLTKDLFIDWRWGEKHFMKHLIDGDLASNNGGWQWSASTGTDAAPYFRIFNPISQSEKCDPDGAFIRKYVPELRDIEGDAVHDPSRLPSLLRSRLDYPEVMVDHSKARDRVMEAFRSLG